MVLLTAQRLAAEILLMGFIKFRKKRIARFLKQFDDSMKLDTARLSFMHAKTFFISRDFALIMQEEEIEWNSMLLSIEQMFPSHK